MNRKKLRYYQQDCVKAIIDAWNSGIKTPYVSVMTGLGKSLIIADIIDKTLKKNKRTLCLVPRMELVQQNYKEAFDYIENKSDLGIICSMIGKRDLHKNAIIAMYQSFKSCGKVDVCIIDECDSVSNNPNSMYRKIIRSLLLINPKMLVVGLTATPYRLGQGMLHNNCILGQPLFTDLVYDTSPDIHKLIDEGHLCLVNMANTSVSVDLTGIKMSGLDYNQQDCGKRFDKIVEKAVNEMEAGFEENNIKTALIFASSIDNANKIINFWEDKDSIRLVHGKMGKSERIEIMNWLKNGDHKRYLVNIMIATRGFNFPALDAIGLLMATTSAALLVQITGRLLRPHEGKAGLVWDYGSNFYRLGTIDNIVIPRQKLSRMEAHKKICGLCEAPNVMSAKKCKECEAEFVSTNDMGKYTMRSRAEIFASKRQEWYHEVNDVQYIEAISRANGCKMVKIKYHEHYTCCHEEYLFLDHPGNIRNKSRLFFMSMFHNTKDYFELMKENEVNVENALHLINNYPEYFKKPIAISISKMPSDKYKRLDRVDYEHIIKA